MARSLPPVAGKKTRRGRVEETFVRFLLLSFLQNLWSKEWGDPPTPTLVKNAEGFVLHMYTSERVTGGTRFPWPFTLSSSYSIEAMLPVLFYSPLPLRTTCSKDCAMA